MIVLGIGPKYKGHYKKVVKLLQRKCKNTYKFHGSQVRDCLIEADMGFAADQYTAISQWEYNPTPSQKAFWGLQGPLNPAKETVGRLCLFSR